MVGLSVPTLVLNSSHLQSTVELNFTFCSGTCSSTVTTGTSCFMEGCDFLNQMRGRIRLDLDMILKSFAFIIFRDA